MELDYGIIFGIDKQMHFLSYTGFSMFLSIVFICISDYNSMKRRMTYLWMGLVIIGVLEEYRQYLLPGRSAEVLDAMANMLGITVGIAAPLIILYSISYRNHFLVRLFVLYVIILIPMVLGLIYINESPFVTLDDSVQERVRSFVTLIGW